MSKLVELDIILRLYEQNFRNLHWNAKGMDFNDSHKSISNDYYEMISKDVDKIAEMEAILGMNPMNYREISEAIDGTDRQYFLVDSKRHYSRAEVVKASDVMLNDICNVLAAAIEELDQPINAGIKSELETLLYNYTVEARYINKRRMEE